MARQSRTCHHLHCLPRSLKRSYRMICIRSYKREHRGRMSGFSSYVAAAGMVEGVGLVMVLGDMDMGEVDSGIRDLGTGGTFTVPHFSVSMGLHGGDMDHIIMDRILIMEAIPILAMD